MYVKKKRRVYLCQVNNKYGNNVFLPYSVGLLQAFCQADPEIRNNFDFGEFIYLRDDPGKVVLTIDNPSVIGISCYIWNWEYNKALAKAVKTRYPECLVVFGGTQAPVGSDGFFVEHPYVDILVHYEGELIFADILMESMSLNPDFTKISGLSVRVDGNHTLKTQPRERISDLTKLQSPYLNGTFDELVKYPYSFHASQETHRGCPYSCTFCDWGGDVFAKVRPFETERLVEEFEWFGARSIDLLYNCDANYGLLPRDFGLTLRMAEVKAKYGFPNKFRAAYAKNSNDKVFAIAKVLNDAGMNKGVTLSFQSMDDQTLGLIKRRNIKIENFQELMARYHREGIITYTELILGLPGETYKTFISGVDTLLEAGQHDAIDINPLQRLTNSEVNNPDYVKVHGIESIHAPLLLDHSTPAGDPVTEYQDLVIATKTMPTEDWKRAYLFAWAVQCFHFLALTQYLAIFLNRQHGVKYSDFYERLLEHCRNNHDTILHQQCESVVSTLENVFKGGRMEIVNPAFGNIVWPLEEGTFLAMIVQKERFYKEIELFLRLFIRDSGVVVDDEVLRDLLVYQASMTTSPYVPESFEINLSHNIHEYFAGVYVNSDIKFVRKPSTLHIRAETFGGDLERYAREIVWYGRKGGRFRHSNVTVEYVAPATG